MMTVMCVPPMARAGRQSDHCPHPPPVDVRDATFSLPLASWRYQPEPLTEICFNLRSLTEIAAKL